MTLEQAETHLITHQIGKFHGTRSELAHAILLLKKRDEEESYKEEYGKTLESQAQCDLERRIDDERDLQ